MPIEQNGENRLPMSTRTTPAELSETLKTLLETNSHELAVHCVQQFMDRIHDQYGWLELRAVLEQVLKPEWRSAEPWIVPYTRVLGGCHDARTILEIGQRSELPSVRLECVWALIHLGRFEQVAVNLDSIMADLTGTDLGFAYQLQARLEFEQGLGWRETWNEVRHRLQGRTLGVALLEESKLYARSGDGFGARQVAFEAADLLERDSYHLAWAQHLIGMSYLFENQTALASTALLEAERLSRKKRAQAFRSRALSGIAALRRAQGDLSLAECQYREAIKQARESEDLVNALWGVGHCERLQNRPEQALEQFRRALRVNAVADWIEAHRALAFLMLRRTDDARAAIAKVKTVHAETATHLTIARAELFRIEGDMDLSREMFDQLPTDGLTIREESRLFQDLFALTAQDSVRSMETLEHRIVKITPHDLVAVWVNGRDIAIKPTSKVAQLLRVLLDHDGRCSIEDLLNNLWPDVLESERDRKRKQLWQHVRDLRDVLGWRGAVLALGGAYALDSKAEWRTGESA
jgi:tetratricopeptide (TPR) repeat protein